MGHPTHQFIAIAGNIGVGKSTLTGLLAEHFGWKAFYEANTDNPYLADFYQDMQGWSFHSQTFFLGKRLEHHRQLLDYCGSVVQDRTVYEDAEIFARNLYERGHMNARDYAAYRQLYEAISSFLPAPDLLIYLEADVDLLLTHIQKRGRHFEQDMQADYLAQLNRLYGDWIASWQACPILKIDMTMRDFQHDIHDLRAVVEAVDKILNGVHSR